MEANATALAPAAGHDPVAALIQTKRSEHTRRAYAADLADFFGGSPPPARALTFLH